MAATPTPVCYDIKHDGGPQPGGPTSLNMLEEVRRVEERLAQHHNIAPEVMLHARRSINPCDLIMHVDATCASHRTINYYKLLDLAAEVAHLRTAACGTTLHLGEAPGCFVDATLYMSNNRANWQAISLQGSRHAQFHPHLLHCKKDNGHARVLLGPDGSGDLLREDVAATVAHECGVGCATLVTADAGGSPILEAAQLLVALRVLGPGGSLVLRLEELVRAESQALVWLCYSMFTHMSLLRPACGDMCHKEVFLVCGGFHAPVDAVQQAAAALSRYAFDGTPLPAAWCPPDERASHRLRNAVDHLLWRYAEALDKAITLAVFLHASGIHTREAALLDYMQNIVQSKAHLAASHRLLKRLLQPPVPPAAAGAEASAAPRAGQ